MPRRVIESRAKLPYSPPRLAIYGEFVGLTNSAIGSKVEAGASKNNIFKKP